MTELSDISIDHYGRLWFHVKAGWIRVLGVCPIDDEPYVESDIVWLMEYQVKA